MKRKIFILNLVILQSCSFIGAGSYYYAERYSLPLSCNNAIQKINEFVDNYPEYKCMQTNEKGETYDSGIFYHYAANGGSVYSKSRTDSSIFYSFYFYFPNIKADVHCIINVSKQVADTTSCTLQLTGVTYSSNWASWKTINNYKEISKEENKMIKKAFETEILDKIYKGEWKRR
jgi:hypothetical protein